MDNNQLPHQGYHLPNQCFNQDNPHQSSQEGFQQYHPQSSSYDNSFIDVNNQPAQYNSDYQSKAETIVRF